MRIDTLICSRSKELSATARRLAQFFSGAGITVRFLVGERSIFEGYAKGFKALNAADEDVVIFCHDDIEILSTREAFVKQLTEGLTKPGTGFVGVAGTLLLMPDGIWWNEKVGQAGMHLGCVFHGKSVEKMHPTAFGPMSGRAVAMDGVFLAAKGSTLKILDLHKPPHFEGDWDFYDIHYTVLAHNLGYINRVVPILIRHESLGQTEGRESWHKNREAFIKATPLPLGRTYWCLEKRGTTNGDRHGISKARQNEAEGETIREVEPRLAWQAPSAWAGLENLFQENLRRVGTIRKVVEIGVDFGYSLFSFAEAMPGARVIGVDPYGRLEAEEHQRLAGLGWKGHPNAERWVSNWLPSFPNASLLRMTSEEAAKDISAPIDVLHIDAVHTYRDVAHDFQLWEPKVRPGGCVMFHDTMSYPDDVGRFFHELRGQKCHIETCHGLGFWYKPTSAAMAPSGLCDGVNEGHRVG